MAEIMIEKEDKLKKETASRRTLVLFNDDEHTFEYVISCLIKFCEHNPLQAEQCTLIAHHNGQCDVKHGTLPYLRHLSMKFTQVGLITEIH